MAAAESIKGRRFAAACGVLSSYVKNAAVAAAAEAEAEARKAALLLMPGSDASAQEEHEAGPAPAPASGAAHAQMTIFYGGRVAVLDDFPAGRAAELLRLAAAGASAAAQGTVRRVELADDLPMARKASLQRFMEKRKGRLAASGVPYRRLDGDACLDHLTLAL